MAKTRKQKLVATDAGRQAPTGAWSADVLMAALHSGTDADRMEALKTAGIIDSNGNLTSTYQNWGKNKVTRTPNV